MVTINLLAKNKLIFGLLLSLSSLGLISMEYLQEDSKKQENKTQNADTIIEINSNNYSEKENQAKGKEHNQIQAIIQELKKLEELENNNQITDINNKKVIKRHVSFSDELDQKSALLNQIEQAAKKKKIAQLTLLLQEWQAINASTQIKNLINRLQECTDKLAKKQEDSENNQKASFQDSAQTARLWSLGQTTVTCVAIAIVLAITEVVKREI